MSYQHSYFGSDFNFGLIKGASSREIRTYIQNIVFYSLPENDEWIKGGTKSKVRGGGGDVKAIN